MSQTAAPGLMQVQLCLLTLSPLVLPWLAGVGVGVEAEDPELQCLHWLIVDHRPYCIGLYADQGR
jgi:hypothetical protein